MGKATKPEINRVTINNTKADTQLVMKLCVDSAKGGNSQNDSKGLVAIGVT